MTKQKKIVVTENSHYFQIVFKKWCLKHASLPNEQLKKNIVTLLPKLEWESPKFSFSI